MIIDTFPDFLVFWKKAREESIARQIEGWAGDYMAKWPELLAMQTEDYQSQGLDWRQVAQEKVFPFLAERLTAMQEAHENLLGLCEPILARARTVLGFADNLIFVIYLGIGCGAGWATTYDGSPAVLFGLENIAECGWSDPESIQGLIAHEIGHLVHNHWRSRQGKLNGSGPWWQLYEEGFAQVCESQILDTEIVHQANSGEEDGWLRWCRDHSGWLAGEFLKTVQAGKSVSAFFGSWYEIRGQSETGYFLGEQIIRELQKQNSLKDIALLEDIESTIRPILEGMSKTGTGGE
jgi:hypothetical protein